MKTFKKVLSLVLTLVMVVGAVVALPTEAKADSIATLTTDVNTAEATGSYTIPIASYLSGYTDTDDIVIKITVTSEGSNFGGCIGINCGTGWDACSWKQESWSANAGTTTLTAEFTDALGDASFQIWWLGDNKPVTIDSISITKKGAETPSESESETTGEIHKFTAAANFDLVLSNYLAGYVDGDDVTVTVKLSSDGTFIGCIGINCGANWDSCAWVGAEQTGAAGTTTWTVDLTDALGNGQIQVWEMNGSYVTIDEITVTEKEAEAPSENGSESESESSPAPTTPEKGDLSDMAIYMVVLMGAALVVVSVVAKKKMA